jgi:hypothetical protein
MLIQAGRLKSGQDTIESQTGMLYDYRAFRIHLQRTHWQGNQVIGVMGGI